jgi:hypothetical protein
MNSGRGLLVAASDGLPAHLPSESLNVPVPQTEVAADEAVEQEAVDDLLVALLGRLGPVIHV